jgi:hypothetical protein
MRHLSHLLRADVHRFKLLLAVWLLIQIMDTLFTGLAPAITPDPRLEGIVGLLGNVLFVARWLGLCVVVPLVLQTHPLVGSEAFWMTRPIPWQALLASKLVLLGTVFVVLPTLCEVLLMALCGVPLAQITRVSLQTILFNGLWLVLLMAVAAVTRNLARYSLVIAGALVGVVLVINVVIAVLIRSMPDGPQLNGVTERTEPSSYGGVVLMLLVIVAAGVQLLVQYRTRRTRVSVGAGLAGLVVAVLVVWFWPSNQQLLPVPAWARREPALRLVPASPIGEFSRMQLDSMPPGDEWRIGGAQLRLSRMQPGWLATVRLVDGSAQFADGTTLATAGTGDASAVPIESGESGDELPAAIVMPHVLGVRRVWQAPQQVERPDRPPAVTAIVVSEADFKKHEGATATYRGRFLVDLDRIEIAARVPLHAGAEYRSLRRRLVIDRVVRQNQAVSVRMRQFTAASMFDPELPGLSSFYLRNRSAANAVEGSEQGVGGVSTSMGLPLLFGGWHSSQASGNGFRALSQFIRFPAAGIDDSALDLGAAWLAGAELVIVQTVLAGSVTRSVQIPEFEFRTAPPRR